jgi:hypothetical protein
MRKHFSKGRKQLTIIITLVLLASVASWYYLDFIPRNEESLDEQHFHWLQKADGNIRTKITAYDTLLAIFLRLYDTSQNREAVNTYMAKYSSANADAHFFAYMSDTAKNYDSTKNTPTNHRPAKHKPTKNKQPKDKPDTAAIKFDIKWDGESQEIILTATKKAIGNDSIYNVSVRYNFEKFIKPVLIQGLFDHYVVFYHGEYIYEDFHSGLGYQPDKEDSLINVGKAMTGANIVSEKVDGEVYRIYLQPMLFFGDTKLIIAGLHSQKELDIEKKQLPPAVGLLALTIAIGLLLLLPLIKLHSLGKYDKINLWDAARVSFVAKMLMSLLILICFGYNSRFRQHNKDQPKKILADGICSAFKREIDSAYQCVKRLDDTMAKYKMYCDIINLGKRNVQLNQRYDVIHSMYYRDIDSLKKIPFAKDSSQYHFYEGLSLLNQADSTLQYAEVNWLDSSGQVRYNWNTFAYNNIHGNYKFRPYFKNIINNETISVPEEKDSVVIEPVISKTSSVFRTILCKSSSLDTSYQKDSVAFVALSFTMKCMDSVVMPAGYCFAIIDKTGDVQYHSKPERNLNENLKEEFSDKKELQDALDGRFKEVFKTKYYEKDYTVRVEPIKGLPYFIVIMCKQSYSDSLGIETFSFTWAMIVVFLLVVIIDIFILIVSSARRSLFKKQYLVSSWLWPRSASRDEYVVAGIGNTIMIVLLICCFFFLPSLNYMAYLFILLCSITISTIFMNTLFAHKYKAGSNSVYWKYKVNSNWWSGVFLVLLNIIALYSLQLPNYCKVLGFEVLLWFIGLLLFRAHKSNPKISNTLFKTKPGYVNGYTYMVFTRLLITSAIPVVFFYTASFNFENNLLSRYRLYDFIQQLQKKFPGTTYPDRPNYRYAIYTDGQWIDSIWINNAKNFEDTQNCCRLITSRDALVKTQEHTATLFNYFGFYLEDVSDVNNDNFYLSSSNDSLYHFNNFFRRVLYDTCGNLLRVNRKIYSTDTFDQAPNGYINIKSADIKYSFPSSLPWRGSAFWVLLAIVLVVFFWLLREVIRKLCSLDLRHVPLMKEMTNDDYWQLLMDNSLLWVTGLPVEDKLKTIKRIISLKNLKSCELDFDKISIDNKNKKTIKVNQSNQEWEHMKSKVLDPENCKVVILLNIAGRLDDEKVTNEKHKCISALLEKEKKIIILSPMHPVHIQQVLDKNLKSSEIGEASEAVAFFNSMQHRFPVIIIPMCLNTYFTPVNQQAFIYEETKYTSFLKNIRNVISKKIQNLPTGKFDEDILALKIQSLSNNFYTGIWQTLSSEEKFILYDLAADGLVNTSNSFAVGLLLNKGLILENDGHLHIFNRSFRSFIVSDIGEKEMAHITSLNKKHSGWSQLRTPLLIVIIAVLVFLAVVQEGVYTKVIGLISGIAAGVPALLGLLSVIGLQNDKEAKNSQT